MDQLHSYVPTKPETKQLSDNIELEDTIFHRILIGGDQLTVARCRGSAAARSDHQTALERLQGLKPVCEDWHAKKSFLMVCSQMYFTGNYCVLLGCL